MRPRIPVVPQRRAAFPAAFIVRPPNVPPWPCLACACSKRPGRLRAVRCTRAARFHLHWKAQKSESQLEEDAKSFAKQAPGVLSETDLAFRVLAWRLGASSTSEAGFNQLRQERNLCRIHPQKNPQAPSERRRHSDASSAGITSPPRCRS